MPSHKRSASLNKEWSSKGGRGGRLSTRPTTVPKGCYSKPVRRTPMLCLYLFLLGTMMPLPSHGRSASLNKECAHCRSSKTFAKIEVHNGSVRPISDESWIHQEPRNEGCTSRGGYFADGCVRLPCKSKCLFPSWKLQNQCFP